MNMYKTYRAFHDAKNRCTNKNHKRYADWGGRGIEFRFEEFSDFYAVLGDCPKGYCLDRIDNDGHYEAGNVRWATSTTQQLNRRPGKHNSLGISGVRIVKSKGLVSTIYQAYIYINKAFTQLYTGPDFFLACCARKAATARYEDLIKY